ncbi:MAG: phosphohydrolase [Cellulosilyticum sp.]|nr:phosphohydrolase [Cellulosilyticum sp.]
MSEIITYVGIWINPLEPKEEMIDIRDIAHALSLVCRGNGHVKFFYSVAQHSISCCMEAKARGYSKEVQLACLLHDGSEAYLSDMTRPVKRKMPEYREIEDKLQNLIWEKYLGKPLSEEAHKQVFEIDDDILSYEFKEIMPRSISEDYKNLRSTPDVRFIDPSEIEEKFMALFHELCHEQ